VVLDMDETVVSLVEGGLPYPLPAAFANADNRYLFDTATWLLESGTQCRFRPGLLHLLIVLNMLKARVFIVSHNHATTLPEVVSLLRRLDFDIEEAIKVPPKVFKSVHHIFGIVPEETTLVVFDNNLNAWEPGPYSSNVVLKKCNSFNLREVEKKVAEGPVFFYDLIRLLPSLKDLTPDLLDMIFEFFDPMLSRTGATTISPSSSSSSSSSSSFWKNVWRKLHRSKKELSLPSQDLGRSVHDKLALYFCDGDGCCRVVVGTKNPPRCGDCRRDCVSRRYSMSSEGSSGDEFIPLPVIPWGGRMQKLFSPSSSSS
jgi:hypothetical protein